MPESQTKLVYLNLDEKKESLKIIEAENGSATLLLKKQKLGGFTENNVRKIVTFGK